MACSEFVPEVDWVVGFRDFERFIFMLDLGPFFSRFRRVSFPFLRVCYERHQGQQGGLVLRWVGVPLPLVRFVARCVHLFWEGHVVSDDEFVIPH